MIQLALIQVRSAEGPEFDYVGKEKFENFTSFMSILITFKLEEIYSI
jgi:hypothetical protein